MIFVLVGKFQQGKTKKVGSLGCNFQFVSGKCEVPDDAKDAHSLLEKFYGAHPVHKCTQLESGEIVLKPVEVPEEEVDFRIPVISGRAAEQPPEPPAFDGPSAAPPDAKKKK